jgi:molybdopterin-guanine dinucleotide biosynthesis protein A
LVVACDVPEVYKNFLKKLIDLSDRYEVVVPRTAKGLEPLLAVYKKTVIPRVEKLLASSERSVLALFDLCRTKYVDIEDAQFAMPATKPQAKTPAGGK